MRMSYFAKGTFEVTNAHIPDGESWYIVGSAPELGGWDACRGLKLDRGHDGVWRGTAYIYNVWNTDVEWKAVRRNNKGCDNHPMRKCAVHSSSWWQPGSNNRIHVGGEHFHGHVDIIHACDRARVEAEARARQENEEKNKYVTFEIQQGETKIGEAYYVVGNVPELGDWDITRAIKLECLEYPTWRAEHVLIHDKWGHKLHWKFVKMAEDRNPTTAVWQTGFDNIVALDSKNVHTECDAKAVRENELSYLRHRVSELEALLAHTAHDDDDDCEAGSVTKGTKRQASPEPFRCPVCRYTPAQ